MKFPVPDDALSQFAIYWLAASFVLLTLAGRIVYIFTISVFYLAFIWALIGVMHFLFSLVQVVRTRGQRRAMLNLAAVPGFAVFVLMAGWHVATISDVMVTQVQFWFLRPLYGRVIDDLQQQDERIPASGRYGFVHYRVEQDQPLRVVFPHTGGIGDNWQGTIYDATDAVAAATGWVYAGVNQEHSAPPDVRQLFGGDIVSCRRLALHYYYCYFT